MRTGVLSDLSSTVLLLMGISGVGAAAAKATDVNRSRLKFENWAWLIQKTWLPAGGLASVNTARWRDLVTSDGEFDVYRFQMLIFSLVVGGALVVTGLTDLASFKIPDNLLGILGLSQIIYIGGKLVSPPTCSDLDDAITVLRGLEEAFVQKAKVTPDPIHPVGQNPLDRPQDLAAAIRRAPDEHDAYIRKAKLVALMFQSTMQRDTAVGALAPIYN